MFEHPELTIEMYTQEMRRVDARNELRRRIRERAIGACAAPETGSIWRRMLHRAAPAARDARDAARAPAGGMPISPIGR